MKIALIILLILSVISSLVLMVHIVVEGIKCITDRDIDIKTFIMLWLISMGCVMSFLIDKAKLLFIFLGG